jgi:hypothetical protein
MIDCRDAETALTTTAAALGIKPGVLLAAIRGYDRDWSAFRIDPIGEFAAGLSAKAGVDVATATIDGAYYFHGTRLIDPESVRERGLISLANALEGVFGQLRELVPEIDLAIWDGFRSDLAELEVGGNSGYQFRLKTGNSALHGGPFAELVRDLFLAPAQAHRVDYLACPEIVEDIALAFQNRTGINLRARFVDATYPCIVKIQDNTNPAGLLPTALVYLSSIYRDGEIGSGCCFGVNLGGAVPPERVTEVDILGLRGSWRDQKAKPQLVLP